jgi:hypothetical protein
VADKAILDRLIFEAGNAILVPLGCKRKGKSRLWFDDHAWWLTVIEFQPSSWDKGTYLNVGVMWLWNPKGHYSFDVGHRVEKFRQFKDEDQFADLARELANRAAVEVSEYREKFPSLLAVAGYLEGKTIKSVWDHYHSAIASGLLGNDDYSLSELDSVLRFPVHAPWVKDLQVKAEALFKENSFGQPFRAAVNHESASARELLKLPTVSADTLPWP